MNEIRTRVMVGADHRISGTAPPEVLMGEHERRDALVALAFNEKLSISRQVLRDYLAGMTPPQTWGKPLGSDD